MYWQLVALKIHYIDGLMHFLNCFVAKWCYWHDLSSCSSCMKPAASAFHGNVTKHHSFLFHRKTKTFRSSECVCDTQRVSVQLEHGCFQLI